MNENEAPQVPQEPEDDSVEQQVIPRWVPILIGLVLVAIAGVAVYTGLRYRRAPLAATVHRAATPAASPGPPGEQQPGASLMFPGEGQEGIPTANAPVTGNARAVVTGSTAGVEGVVRIWARRGMRLDVDPADALITVNDMAIGQASQFDSEDEIYDFAAPGSYTVRVTAPGHVDRTFIVTAAEDAKDDIALIKAKLGTN
jgi:hypothetical protein